MGTGARKDIFRKFICFVSQSLLKYSYQRPQSAGSSRLWRVHLIQKQQTMFNSLFSRFFKPKSAKSNRAARKYHSRPARFESLEDRRVMAVYAQPIYEFTASDHFAKGNNFYKVGNLTYFTVGDEVSLGRHRLWRTDGTKAGTFMVPRESGGPTYIEVEESAGPNWEIANGFFQNFQGKLLVGSNFSGNWKISDGLTSKPILPSQFIDSATPYRGSSIDQMQVVNNEIYFSADTLDQSAGGGTFPGLWKTDGTAAGTKFLTDLKVRDFGNKIVSMTNLNGTLIFTAQIKFAMEQQIWKSDGTPAGTVKYSDVDIPNENFRQFIRIGGDLYFAGQSDFIKGLYKTNGYKTGTVKVSDHYPLFGDMYYFNNSLYFVDGTGNSCSLDLKTNILSTGSIVPVPTASDSGVLGDQLYYSYSREVLLKTSGPLSAAVTIPREPSQPISDDQINFQLDVNSFADSNGLVSDGKSLIIRDGYFNLLKTDGTEAGTNYITDTSGTPVFCDYSLTSLGHDVYFFGHKDGGKATVYRLVRYDATHIFKNAAGSIEIRDLHGNRDIFRVSRDGDNLVIRSRSTDPDNTMKITGVTGEL